MLPRCCHLPDRFLEAMGEGVKTSLLTTFLLAGAAGLPSPFRKLTGKKGAEVWKTITMALWHYIQQAKGIYDLGWLGILLTSCLKPCRATIFPTSHRKSSLLSWWCQNSESPTLQAELEFAMQLQSPFGWNITVNVRTGILKISILYLDSDFKRL